RLAPGRYLRGGRRQGARRHRVLAQRAVVGPGVDREGDPHLVPASRRGALAVLSSLTEKYGHKIKTVEELQRIIGRRPRAKKVIMCHGVFDVVHPGHLRHLLYAKSKADVLVTSITADVHISKGQYRPHVPQELRALNLAAFEIVDYVLIDPNPTPIQN